MDEEQRKCVETPAQHMLIVAGPGSGKTRTVVHKCGALISQGCSPDSIICITFTNKAAGELKQRIQQHLSAAATPSGAVRVGTYHHIALQTLRQYKVGLCADEFTLLTTASEASRQFKKTLGAMNASWGGHAPAVVQLYHTFRLKPGSEVDHVVPPLTSPLGDTLLPSHVVEQCFKKYEAHKRKHYMVDYDDLMHSWLAFLQSTTPEALAEKARVKVVFADEVQDSNDVQHAILTAFAAGGASIVAVGDPDQSIYGFRGSNMQNMIDFASTVPGTVQLCLERNYRSTPSIVRACQQLIEYNHNRIHKNMTSASQASRVEDEEEDDGPVPAVYGFRTSGDETEFVTQVATKALQHGQEVAVLCRTNREVDAFSKRFERARLPFSLLKGSLLLERPHVQQLLHLYKFVFCRDPPTEVIQQVAILHRATKSAAAKFAADLQQDTAENSIAAVFLKMRVDQMPVQLKSLFDSLLSTIGALNEIHAPSATLHTTPHSPSATSHTTPHANLNPRTYHAHAMRIGCACVNHLTMMNLATANSEEQDDLRQVEELRASFQTFQEFQDAIALGHVNSNSSSGQPKDDLPIKLGTIHQAKGLEFESCVITGCADGNIPLATSMSSLRDVEEERRLLFVAASRAKHQLCFTYAYYAPWDDEHKKKRRLSQFLRPLLLQNGVEWKGPVPPDTVSPLPPLTPAKQYHTVHDLVNHFMQMFGRFHKLYGAATAMLKFKLFDAGTTPSPLFAHSAHTSYLAPTAQNELLFKQIFLALFRTPEAEWKDVVDAAAASAWGEQLYLAQRATKILKGIQLDAGMPASTWPSFMDAVQALADRLLAAEPQRLAVTRTVKVGDKSTTVDLVIDNTLFSVCYTKDEAAPSHSVIHLLAQSQLLNLSQRYTITTYVLYNMYTGQLWRAPVPASSALHPFAASLPPLMRDHPLVHLIAQ